MNCLKQGVLLLETVLDKGYGLTNMGTLELYKVPYDIYLKFILKGALLLLVTGGIIVSVAPMLGIL